MTNRSHDVDPQRRRLLRTAAASAALLALRDPAAAQSGGPLLVRPIPSTGEMLPAVGLGTWITFNVGDDPAARDSCAEVMRAFFADGGRVIDSSPMYGSSQPVIGHGLRRLGQPAQLFSAEKVWIGSGARGRAQLDASRRHWGVARFDLVQVHNLLAWEEHLPILFEMKAAGAIRYVGITTSEGRRHRDFEEVMRRHPLDFVQLTYNLLDREAEERLLPLARERRIAVLANRPFREGALLRQLERHPLPPWAGEIGARSWAQVVLKFILAHPAITCAIPATTSVAHVRENLAAARGPLPDDALRRRMIADVARL
ncbi:MAG: aldo/keto reductase [Betaproteobacteria bacterium]|jgi:diketogulonate reductase-like aldo/keto reductase|nr:aldo/keto reductase [Betaproteobacteria bacterium]MDH5287689.1 aldo/keto reductase [Betaproteobacteria bacterium]